MERLVTHQINAGVMEKKNSMESVTTAINRVTKLMNARRNQNLKVNVTNAKDMVTRHQNVDLNHSIQLMDGTTISSVDVIIAENMDTLA